MVRLAVLVILIISGCYNLLMFSATPMLPATVLAFFGYAVAGMVLLIIAFFLYIFWF